jgi:hypothetical protein
MSANSDHQKNAFEFLLRKYQGQDVFSKEEFQKATGWAEGTFDTYWSKQFKGILVRVGDSYRVHGVFGQYTKWPKFRDSIVTQKRRLARDYSYSGFETVIVFEFFMPLRNEEYLRKALDALFFKDSVLARLRTLKTTQGEALMEIFTREPGESDERYFSRLCQWVGDKFVGYSIHHVSGRFKVGELRTREESVRGELQTSERYLVDETTAVVRFIIPCGPETKMQFRYERGKRRSLVQPDLIPGKAAATGLGANVQHEADQIRWFFTRLFVERIIEVVVGEDEVWLLESGVHSQLHIWRGKE